MTATDAGSVEEPRQVQVAGDEPACGKFVCKDGDEDVFCDLPAGHAETIPCSAPLERSRRTTAQGSGVEA